MTDDWQNPSGARVTPQECYQRLQRLMRVVHMNFTLRSCGLKHNAKVSTARDQDSDPKVTASTSAAKTETRSEAPWLGSLGPDSEDFVISE